MTEKDKITSDLPEPPEINHVAESNDCLDGIDENILADSEESTETHFNDRFISYARSMELPLVRIETAECLQEKRLGLGIIQVLNRSDFPYNVGIRRTPDWLIVNEFETNISCGEKASFSLGIDMGRVPPGEVSGVGEFVVRHNIINLAYQFEVKLAVEYIVPVPAIEVEAVAGGKSKTLRIAVRNAGGGLLDGYCYDRARNERHRFLLAGNTSSPGTAPTSDGHQLFKMERVFQDFDEVRGGILVLCDCINERFRRFEIHPRTYFDKEPFADVSLIDFMQVDSGQRHEREIKICHPDFLYHCSVVIPPQLREHLSYLPRSSAGHARFLLSEGASVIGSAAAYVEFNGTGGRRHRLPVIVSFSGGTQHYEEQTL